jgi:hypothetical protein
VGKPCDCHATLSHLRWAYHVWYYALLCLWQPPPLHPPDFRVALVSPGSPPILPHQLGLPLPVSLLRAGPPSCSTGVLSPVQHGLYSNSLLRTSRFSWHKTRHWGSTTSPLPCIYTQTQTNLPPHGPRRGVGINAGHVSGMFQSLGLLQWGGVQAFWLWHLYS